MCPDLFVLLLSLVGPPVVARAAFVVDKDDVGVEGVGGAKIKTRREKRKGFFASFRATRNLTKFFEQSEMKLGS